MEQTYPGVFETLFSVNVNEHTEDKPSSNGTKLTYLSWPFAWAEVKRRYPDAHYEVKKHDGLPYICDPETGYMVFTEVTIGGITHEMWLPVMDGSNNAMKKTPYTIKTKSRDITVRPATMMDINKAIMRCLVKNLAMFGMGLYIYAGEDLPVPEQEQIAEEKKQAEVARAETIEQIKQAMAEKGYAYTPKCKRQLDEMDQDGLESYLESLSKMPDKKKEEEKKTA